jgi:rhodanese-related sulfurtransferase
MAAINENSTRVSEQLLAGLEPLASLSQGRLGELADVCFIERITAGFDPFRVRGLQGQSVYLLSGELELTFVDGTKLTVAGGTPAARHPLGRGGRTILRCRALYDGELIRIDDDLLDIMVTWDQLAGRDAPSSAATGAGSAQKKEIVHDTAGEAVAPDWSMLSGVFSVKALNSGPLSHLPPEHVDELLRRFKRIRAKRGDTIVRQGAEGDFYYLIESGRCNVAREIGGVSVALAELKSGDAFGEEALVSGARRNATVTMKTDGVLLRLPSQDFAELLKQPLLNRTNYAEAQQMVAAGALWLDVRYPSEYQHDRLDGAINVPLNEIRNAFGLLDASRQYIVYCQTGTRSSAATFLLAQRGYHAILLERGLAGAARRG